ncbi:MAG: prepilin-type N-terminal cleavage/methylation domain-containing protein [Acidovorax sp.]|nr:prepilin-type N-terminal cleavage/methylation domain-containing protein [Acidovorax sp.]
MPPLSRFAPSPRGGDAPGGLAEPVPRVRWPRTAPVLQVVRGFTLVELLLAIAVMSLLAILSWRGLDGMVRAQEITRQRADEMLVLQAALGQWGTDLDALMPVANTTPLDWDGQVLRLTRRSSAVPDEGALVVAWTRRNANGAGQWLRWQSPPVRTRSEWQQAWQQAAQWARTPGDAERRYEVTLLPLDSWQIFYYRGGAWSNPLSSTGTTPGDSSAAIPDGVRLQITLPPGQALAGQLTRDWVNPVLGGGRS